MNYLPYIFIMFPLLLFSQIKTVEKDSTEYDYYLIEGDSIPRDTIRLNEIYVMNGLKFPSKEDRITSYNVCYTKLLRIGYNCHIRLYVLCNHFCTT